MTIATRFAGAAAALALAAAPAVALAHGDGHGHDGPGGPNADHHRAPARAAIGTVASYAGGVLTVKLADGSSYAGKVVDRTVLLCDSAPTSSTTTPPSTPTPTSTATPASYGLRGASRHRRHGRARGLCGPDALVAGAQVADARIVLTGAGGVWRKVELLP